jgi:hypothetical protein
MSITAEFPQGQQVGIADLRVEGRDFVFRNVPIYRTPSGLLNLPYEIDDFTPSEPSK